MNIVAVSLEAVHTHTHTHTSIFSEQNLGQGGSVESNRS